ncbi:MAG TPA: hypothetical protein VK141_02405, partial [Nitrosomonas sp.]|nr:hypothetical protein [Nitrosomonas sp.]
IPVEKDGSNAHARPSVHLRNYQQAGGHEHQKVAIHVETFNFPGNWLKAQQSTISLLGLISIA